ncbi:MAG TPA: septum formation initiator family protein [Candidatus Paceibacterota bacterium]|nr:septum formation initiator family protein [Candidatus Paceibacterota bacterium]
MNVNLGIWSKLTRVVIFLLLLAGILIVAASYLPLIQKNERFRREVLRLEEQKRKEEETQRQLKTSIDTLRHDPKAVERLARRNLGFAKPDEKVILFQKPPTNPPPSAMQ